jgi:hypothetical protein
MWKSPALPLCGIIPFVYRGMTKKTLDENPQSTLIFWQLFGTEEEPVSTWSPLGLRANRSWNGVGSVSEYVHAPKR